jgi:hypothetical protein
MVSKRVLISGFILIQRYRFIERANAYCPKRSINLFFIIDETSKSEYKPKWLRVLKGDIKWIPYNVSGAGSNLLHV